MTCLRRLITVCLVGLMASCATIGRFNILTTEEEVQIGREAAREIERDLTFYYDPVVTAYINSLGQMLARYSRRSGLTYYFKVVDTDDVNAFALPGGWLYVNRGLITTAENESELAAVIAHEIGHVDRKHGARAISREFGAAVILDATLGGENASVRRQVLRQVAALSKGIGQLQYGRDAEREADRFAVDATYASGIDPKGAATFFQKLVALRENEPGRLEVMFSTHPPSRERVENVWAQIGELPARAGLTSDSRRFQEIKKRILERDRVRRGKKARSTERRRR